MFTPRIAFFVSLVMLGGCAAASERDVAGSTSQSVETSLLARIEQVGALVEARGADHVYVVVETAKDDELPWAPGAPLEGDARRAAALDCAIYGGGAASDPKLDEDPSKYLDEAARADLARQLLDAVGNAPLHRFDSFGIGDAGNDFSARCTLGVRVASGELVLVQGHGRDRF